jgi:hypothetical protein
MSQQPSFFSTDAPPTETSPSPDSTPQRPRQAPRQIPRWLQYLELSIRVVVRLYIGLVLVVLPWTHLWNSNHFLLLIPHLAPIVLNGITRGIVSGLGLLNIWIAGHDAIHYKEG